MRFRRMWDPNPPAPRTGPGVDLGQRVRVEARQPDRAAACRQSVGRLAETPAQADTTGRNVGGHEGVRL
jgi:hypothetical protein